MNIPESYKRINCPKCGNSEQRVTCEGKDFWHGLPGAFFVGECAACGFSFQSPRPADEFIADFYPSDYLPHSPASESIVSPGMVQLLRKRYGYDQISEKSANIKASWRTLPLFDFIRRYNADVALTPNFVSDGRLLEIGCGSGSTLLRLKRLGWGKMYGVELMPTAADHARQLGFEVTTGDIDSAIDQFPDNYFDVIISAMVVEHLPNPFRIVQKVAKKIKSGGQFLFSTVTRDSIEARMYGLYWFGYDLPRHLVYFRDVDIRDMLARDFDNIAIVHQPSALDFIRSATFRTAAGRGTVLDKVVLRLGASRIEWMTLLLALLRMTDRVSIRCRKK